MIEPARESAVLLGEQVDGRTDMRRAYEPPRILAREPLEALATTCDIPSGGKGMMGMCAFNQS
jgi:hypothetical protein